MFLNLRCNWLSADSHIGRTDEFLHAIGSVKATANEKLLHEARTYHQRALAT